ncbi:MAG: exonuclease SbcCD subunit D [Chloroflexi bacterium]|nr:exonuclease SbcCD subunit D [Chloroflexota bacterium]MDA1241198.1 exonuclease SbcCD subunit D [Chloroflexota bacterium]
MRILHTSDWHIGKRIGRYDRSEEFLEAFDQVLAIAEEREVDLVVFSGDLFDKPSVAPDLLRTGMEALTRLADGGQRPVVAIAGNHDSSDLFEVLAPYLRPLGVHLVGQIRSPDQGGVLHIETASGPAAVACFPFLREGRVVDFMQDVGAWYGAYQDRVGAIFEAYGRALEAHARDAVTVLTAHVAVPGVTIGGRALGRGERELHMGQSYMASAAALPSVAQYTAMGHIHAAQRVPGAPAPAEYAGSLLPLDFGETDDEKRVVLVTVEPRGLAQVERIRLSAGRPLFHVEGTWDEIVARRDEINEGYLDLVIRTDGPDPSLASRAAEMFRFVVKVRADYPALERRTSARRGRAWRELYGEFHEEKRNVPAPDTLLAAFDEVQDAALDEVFDASA